jgi:hypothetical protein
MRRFLGEPEIPMPYKHPLIESHMKVLKSHEGLIGSRLQDRLDICRIRLSQRM